MKADKVVYYRRVGREKVPQLDLVLRGWEPAGCPAGLEASILALLEAKLGALVPQASAGGANAKEPADYWKARAVKAEARVKELEG